MKYVAWFAAVVIALAVWNANSISRASDDRNLSSVNGGVTAAAGQTYDTVSTVNGGLTVGKGAIAHVAKTVNGGITVDDDAKIGNVSTVNGGLRIADHVTVEHEATTVNGGIRIGKNSSIGGDVSTVSGGIELRGSEVSGSVITRNGDIDLADGAHVRGSIHVKPKNDSGWGWGWKKDDVVRVTICGTCVVDGELRFERKVELHVEPGAKVGKVIGDEVQRL